MPTAETIQAHIARLRQAPGADAAPVAKAIDAYKRALAQLQVLAEWKARAEAFEAAARTAPEKLAATKEQLAATTRPAATTLPAGEDLPQRLTAITAELTDAKKTLADLENEPKRRAERRLILPKLVEEATQRLARLEKELAALPPETAPDLLAARRAELAVLRAATRAELDCYARELASYDAERDLLTARLDLASRRVTVLSKLQADLQAAFERRRKEQAERAAREAERAAARAARAHAALKPIAAESARYARERTGPDGLPARISRVTARLAEVRGAIEALQQGFKALQEKEKVIGQTATFGVLLRKQRADLPDVDRYRRKASERQAEIARAQLRLIELRDRRLALPDTETALLDISRQVRQTAPPAQRQRILDAARELLEDRRKNLDALINDYDAYFAGLVDLQVQVGALLSRTDEIARYVDERVLWIRSGSVLGPGHIRPAAAALAWLLAPAGLARAAGALAADTIANPLPPLIALLLLAVFLWKRKALGRALADAGSTAGEPTGPANLARAAALTGLLAAIVPAGLWLLAWRLGAAAETIPPSGHGGTGPSGTVPAAAIAAGLTVLATMVLTLNILAEVCRPRGLAESHFGLPAAPLGQVRRSLHVLTVLLAGPVFLVGAMEAQEVEAWRNSLGRIALLALLLVVAVFAHRLLRSAGPVRSIARAAPRAGWPQRLRKLWHVLAVIVPVALAALAVAGYYYTAHHLTGRLAVTFWLVAGVALVHAVGLRWIALAARSLEARRRRRPGDGRGIPVRPGPPSRQADSDPALHPAQRLARLEEHVRQFTGTAAVLVLLLGAWGIWADSLPALGALRRVQVWSYTGRSTVRVPAPDGQTVEKTVEVDIPVTLASLGLAGLVAVLAAAAGRHLPELTDVALLQRLGMDAGARYATRAILRYVLVVAGTVWVFHLLGVGWSNIQWLVAAVTVGLGFGLQEIFANFVSGLIILFERPIRIGDTVTIGETAGTVTRIRIRATTITDWDRKELIVPNKEFVTARLINWTLSDKVLRLVLRVGVAYGSDTRQVERILREVAHNHPLVLTDPEPVILFAGFGDNTLDFELRVYISGIEQYLRVRHELNLAIDDAFRRAGITIAFPQRDVHLDSLRPVDVRILRTGPES